MDEVDEVDEAFITYGIIIDSFFLIVDTFIPLAKEIE